MSRVIDKLDRKLTRAKRPSVETPDCTFSGFLGEHAHVRLNDGRYVRYSFAGRRPLIFIADLVDKIIRNCLHGATVEIDGIVYKPGQLKGATIAVCGGAQFGKTVLALNCAGWLTTIEFRNFGFYSSDQELLGKIVDTKFRPDVVDQVAWMPALIQLNKAEGRSAKSVNTKNAFMVSDGERNAFGYFIGLQKPTTSFSLDLALLDEVDDIPEKNIGFVSGRMTNSDLQLTWYMGTQRIHGAGQNARWQAGTMHKWLTPCPDCGAAICIEEHWPQVCRVAVDGSPAHTDPQLAATMQYDPDALYYPACLACGARLDPDAGAYQAEHPERARQRNWSIRVSQMDTPGIKWRDIVASWFAALVDPNPQALVAWHCDRRAIPHAGAAQPITPDVLSRARSSGFASCDEDLAVSRPYAMSLARQGCPRVAGLDTGPRCWLWVNDVPSPLVSPLVWAEMIPSGTAFARILELAGAGLLDCVLIDAGGEPDLTKRLCLALNGLAEYRPPVMPLSELRRAHLGNIGAGVTWDGPRGMWRGIRAAAVAFCLREGGGVQHDLGLTQEGQIYPLIKCNRAESIQGLVNDFLTPAEGVAQHVALAGAAPALRTLPRQRLPEACLGAGVTDSMLSTHLQNLRKGGKPGALAEDWLDGVENHLGLAAVYARLAAQLAEGNQVQPFHYASVAGSHSRDIRARRAEGVLL